eukprot:TRINITY_DN72560_c0_g1_i1.p1 TRINITY_DN72560_c0_g1~~TRINITY_DN72560_c0_g1_i1.p1  ORF type:complete len:482 (+),score=48.16 TRINITY_DN72560_c0_g1_i1:135-1580(+)
MMVQLMDTKAPIITDIQSTSNHRLVAKPVLRHPVARPPRQTRNAAGSRYLVAIPILTYVRNSACRKHSSRHVISARHAVIARRSSDKGTLPDDDSSQLLSFLSALDAGEFDKGIKALEMRNRRLKWEQLPERLFMLRHGESEGNIDHTVYSIKGDSQLELSHDGLRQAREAGSRLRDLVGDDKVCVIVSPFERAQQTLLCLYQGGFPEDQVGQLRIDPRIREKEFGNFQTAGTVAALRIEEQVVGRFYYRLPNAESCADVLDRVDSFWNWLLDSSMLSTDKFGTCLLVTHGLTIRLLLMHILGWTVRTFETVHNPGNCNHVALKKNMDKLCYELCPEESYPPQAPWSTLEIWIRLKSQHASPETRARIQQLETLPDSLLTHPHVAGELDAAKQKLVRECSKPYTIVDYMMLPKPTGPVSSTTMHLQPILERLVEGHGLGRLAREELLAQAGKTGLQISDIHSIDWLGDCVSFRGKQLREQR